jgi:hypothetical protein
VHRIGVTGHVALPEDVASWVAAALARRLGSLPSGPLHGITCLARGADQLFARAVLALRGTFEVVLPAADYGQMMIDAGHGEDFRELLRRAQAVETLPFASSCREAYLAASEAMLDRCDLLLAVWDGRPSRRMGDTADVVRLARERELPVEVFWPPLPSSSGAPTSAIPAAAPDRG